MGYVGVFFGLNKILKLLQNEVLEREQLQVIYKLNSVYVYIYTS